MSELKLTKTRLFEGVWEGVLCDPAKAPDAPAVEVTHLQQPVQGVAVIALDLPGEWVLRVPIPPETIADGVQTYVIRALGSGQVLDSFTLMAGDALSYDIRAEIGLLREELDLLKRAFRRHCLDTL